MTRVLLVEDDAWLAEVEAGVLTGAGFEVQVAPHAPAAIDLVDSFQPEVIVLDVLLAGSTAFALLNELQSYSDTAMVPIILCTNIADQFDAAKLKEYGVNRVVDKTTMHPDDLIAAVRSVV
ncbi:MAG: response regulator BaeR [Candidatus Saccharibacteria bacterium]|nr:response regulator BaeR [Candidatus Saccharibacteria bacterium]MDB5180959.1 response regulator BaeR [Candidatus Saccharibacteria bacterium]